MLIDWFTVAAQALNFLILVWVLKHFLYQPILQAIDAREQRIAKSIADAEKKQAEAKTERDDFHHKNETFDRERAALLAQATEAANAERQRLLDEARATAAALAAKRQEALATEAANLNQTLRRRVQDEVFAISRKTLGDLATADLDAQIGAVFIERLRALTDPAKAALAAELTKTTGPALVRSTFALPEAGRLAIQTAVNQTFSADIPLRFAVAPDQVAGIELSANGHKIAWSIADYLASLEKGVKETLKAPAGTASSS